MQQQDDPLPEPIYTLDPDRLREEASRYQVISELFDKLADLAEIDIRLGGFNGTD